MTMALTEPDPYAAVVGRAATREFLSLEAAGPVHAYLFVGASEVDRLDVARAFAADLVSRGLPAEERERTVRLILAGGHADVVYLGGAGEAILIDDAREWVRKAVLAPVEGPVKVMIGVSMDTARPDSLPALLKAVEEPTPSTVFVLLTESVSPHLVTIASRCVRVDIQPLTTTEVRADLAKDPAFAALPSERLDQAATGSVGDITRARLLVTDERFSLRMDAWAAVPESLDGTGAVVSEMVRNLMSIIDEAVTPMKAQHEVEVAAADEEFERYGMRSETKSKQTARHKRELKRFTDGEYVAGLGVMARTYRDAAAAGVIAVAVAAEAVAAIDEVCAHLVFNPSWKTQLTGLFLALPPLPRAR
jgi:DNA polymerase-3 subunit delta'